MQVFEKLGVFYLGRQYDLDRRQPREDLVLYDSKDLTTHAVCVGMTGSGKTGLCLALLEEAAIDGIPVIAIDPKGDLGNLCLTFPNLAADDFLPWIDQSAAAQRGLGPQQYAADVAKQWREGLAAWGQQPERVGRFREAVDLAIYTPGGTAGLPLTVLQSFRAPPAALVADGEAFRDRVLSAASGLLALLGIEPDPVRSREHILVSNVLTHAWQRGKDLDLASLVRDIQTPPFTKVGVVDLDGFFPEKDRFALAMQLNSLLASPSFAAWMEGEPLDVKRLLYTPEGKPRLSILSIAHLSDAERMFFVTILLNEVLAWVRTQPGTSSLRAILYMDEVFGYFPPTANPPSKTPMLTLLKQARAFGLGVVLATQNPVDLDYKGLSNTGTWFLGRLQTERDKARVLEGLEGASAQANATFDRQAMEKTLAGLGNRVFLMNNVHEDAPVVFQTRWALSYLRGPLTREQIQTLMAPRKQQAGQARASESASVSSGAAAAAGGQVQPVSAAPLGGASPDRGSAEIPSLPSGVRQQFLPLQRSAGEAGPLYRPALLGRAKLHFINATAKVDAWVDRSSLAPVEADDKSVWDHAALVNDADLELEDSPPARARIDAPDSLRRSTSYKSWSTALKDHLYATQTLTLWRCPALKQVSEPQETEGDFRIRLSQRAKELRDDEVDQLRKKYAAKLASLQSKIGTAEERVAREQSQYQQSMLDTALSFGGSVLGALFGRKITSAGNVQKAATGVSRMGRTVRERGEAARAGGKVEDLKQQLADLEAELEAEIDRIKEAYQSDSLELEETSVRPRKSDIRVEELSVVWLPWIAAPDGTLRPGHELCAS
jgi:hypothetical protein